MFLFTDGLTEANDPQGNMFGEARLDKLLQDNITASPDELLAEALSSVELFVDGAEASDDITLLSIRRTNLV